MTDTATTTEQDTEPPAGPAADKDWQAEAEKWKSLARKHEEKAKSNLTAVKELEQLRQQTMSDTERAVAEAAATARAETLKQVGSRVVAAEFRATAAAARLTAEQVDTLLAGLDLSRFVDDDGEPLRDQIAAFVAQLAPPEPANPLVPDLGQGTRGAPALNSNALEDALRRAVGA